MKDGIPDRYGKQIPLKEEYIATTIDPVYSIPLYKLVYNQSVITSHHWEWDSNKIKGEEANRRIREYLYNSPALYGKELMVIANFSYIVYTTKANQEIQPHTALILNNQKKLFTIS
ncbi:hypothetical protein BH746_11855 [Enterococcus faecalis]|nr:hypothetical protein BH746_11855 [Enterococcus faecalis]